jgi:hypothetical protein
MVGGDDLDVPTPKAFPPKSSTAIFAAVTDPTPPNSAYRPDWSLSTPIRIGPPCANADPTDPAATTAARATLVFQLSERFILASSCYSALLPATDFDA